jgi:hypothetical protein
MTRRGVVVDRDLLETAALLHDLDKALPNDHPFKQLGHGAAGAAWLTERGYAELAPAVAMHPVMRIGEADTYEAWADAAGLEGRVVAYADKRARQDILSLDDRFARWHEQYPGSPALDEAHERARRLEAEICELAGIGPEDVAREAWVEEAMRAAA